MYACVSMCMCVRVYTTFFFFVFFFHGNVCLINKEEYMNF